MGVIGRSCRVGASGSRGCPGLEGPPDGWNQNSGAQLEKLNSAAHNEDVQQQKGRGDQLREQGD